MSRFCLAVTLLSFLLSLHPVFGQAKDPGTADKAKSEERKVVDKLPEVPKWLKSYRFKHDKFVFARVRYQSFGRGWGWDTDYPDADKGLSQRVKRWTSLNVAEEGAIVRLSDPKLSDYPFLYMTETGNLILRDAETKALRKYLLDGGFLLIDDFWGKAALENTESELKRVFPNRKPVELPLKHPIFHCVFDLKERPQVCAIGWALRNKGNSFEPTRDGSDTSQVHYRAILDDKKRIMVLLCNNTDLADGWERNGSSEYYTREFSEKRAFPMGMNIVFYALNGGATRKAPAKPEENR